MSSFFALEGRKCLSVLLCALGAVAFSGCGGGGGGSAPPPTGLSATQLSVVVKTLASVSTNICPNGGITVISGIDTNGNGVLDGAEGTNTQYVCNGLDGSNGSNGLSGTSALVAIGTEPVGLNCVTGGSKVTAGLDLNGNSVLDVLEVSSTGYICGGSNGTNGTNGANGTNGLNSLVKIVSEPVGTNCTYGGNKVTAGLDSNSNNVLENPEVTSTAYVCNGAPVGNGTPIAGVLYIQPASITLNGISVNPVGSTPVPTVTVTGSLSTVTMQTSGSPATAVASAGISVRNLSTGSGAYLVIDQLDVTNISGIPKISIPSTAKLYSRNGANAVFSNVSSLISTDINGVVTLDLANLLSFASDTGGTSTNFKGLLQISIAINGVPVAQITGTGITAPADVEVISPVPVFGQLIGWGTSFYVNVQ